MIGRTVLVVIGHEADEVVGEAPALSHPARHLAVVPPELVDLERREVVGGVVPVLEQLGVGGGAEGQHGDRHVLEQGRREVLRPSGGVDPLGDHAGQHGPLRRRRPPPGLLKLIDLIRQFRLAA